MLGIKDVVLDFKHTHKTIKDKEFNLMILEIAMEVKMIMMVIMDYLTGNMTNFNTNDCLKFI